MPAVEARSLRTLRKMPGANAPTHYTGSLSLDGCHLPCGTLPGFCFGVKIVFVIRLSSVDLGSGVL